MNENSVVLCYVQNLMILCLPSYDKRPGIEAAALDGMLVET